MTRALVLGGGGPVGIAWESGLAAGLAEGGVNIGEADLIIGTSAGSAVGAQLAMGRSPQQMYAAVAADSGNARPGPTRANTGAGGAPPELTPLMELMQKAGRGDVPAEEIRKEMGAFALAVTTGVEGPMADVSKKRLEGELTTLKESGSSVTLITPDAPSREAFGVNLMDFTRRAPAAEAGLAQGRAEAEALNGKW